MKPCARPGCSAVIGVLAAAARHGSAAAVAAVERQCGGDADALSRFYAVTVVSCHSLIDNIRCAGKLGQLSDADALRPGSAASLAVRAAPGELASEKSL